MARSAYQYALSILARTPKTIKMMQQKLLMKWYDMETTTKTLERLSREDYLNDEAFCEAYTRSAMINKWKSYIYTKNKLYQKWIPETIIETVFDELEDEIQEELIIHLKRTIRKLSESWKDMMSIYERLARQWHRYDDIKEALEELSEQDS